MKSAFLLLAEHESGDIPLDQVARKYFNHDQNKMKQWARQRKYPFPIYRGGSTRSQWLVSVDDLGLYLDELKEEARRLHIQRV